MKPFCEISKSIQNPQNSIGTIVLAMTRGEVHDIGKTVIKGLFQYHHFKVIDLGAIDSAEKLLQAIQDHQPNAIGLSAMLNSSLSEMQVIAAALSEAGCTLPLLIGGASTTLAHTAMFIAPKYTTGRTIHVHDLHYCEKIIPDLLTPHAMEDNNEEARDDFLKTLRNKKILTYKDARAKGLHIEWNQKDIVTPSFLGTKIFTDYNLKSVLDVTDWTTLFMAYGMKGKFPSILKDKELGEAAQALYQEAQEFCTEVLDQKSLTGNAVIGFYPANSSGDDIEIEVDGQKHIYHTLRQQAVHGEDKPYYALSDFVAPKESGIQDYVGLFVVTAGIGLQSLVSKYEIEGNIYKTIMAKSVADILAESFAEHMHKEVRTNYWGYAPKEDLSIEEIFQCRFQGIRPAPGYPACPDHSEKPLIFDILQAKKNIGVGLTETYAMDPMSSICGVYFAHPQARYFWIGALGDDQFEDYAQRKALSIKEVKKQLAFHVSEL